MKKIIAKVTQGWGGHLHLEFEDGSKAVWIRDLAQSHEPIVGEAWHQWPTGVFTPDSPEARHLHLAEANQIKKEESNVKTENINPQQPPQK